MQLALAEEALRVVSIEPQALVQGTHNGDEGGTNGWIDTQGYSRAEAEFLFGAVADTLTQVDMQVFENDANTGNGTQIDGAVQESSGAAVDKQSYIIDVRMGGRANRKRYIRPRLIIGPNGTAYGAIVIRLYDAYNVPVSQTVAPVLV